ncbi:hypothetical protein [Streptomyces nitrosporeus]|uniref:hypothetical protein n=1 Tax=Streptomyces nitrosporeus TaxID=28894 RepID=UPI00331F7637
MRTGVIAVLITAGLLTSLTACGIGDPPYTVRLHDNKDGSATANLNLPEGTKDEAEAAIRDYAGTLDGLEWVNILVSDDTADGKLICNAIWMKDEKAAQKWSGGRFESATWPGLDVRCPHGL